MKRTPLRRRTPLKPRSQKRERLMVERRKLVQKVLLNNPRCEFPTGKSGVVVRDMTGRTYSDGVRCTMPACDVHEVKSRARGGSILDEANFLVMCRFHHSYLHDHPAEATALGLLVSGYGA